MPFFRKSLNIADAVLRPAHLDDLPRISRLLAYGAWRYHEGLSGADTLPVLLARAPGIVFEANDEIWACALLGRVNNTAAWVRALGLTGDIDRKQTFDLLVPGLHAQARRHGLQRLYCSVDPRGLSWLWDGLRLRGYEPDTEVVVYEKRQFDVPSFGNNTVQVRPAYAVDLTEITRIDHLCFEDQWAKEEDILYEGVTHTAISLLAIEHGQAVGYAYATSHLGGKLVHLVRIAVDPRVQGKRIGIRLLAEVVERAAQRNATALTLNTQAYNERARRLYEWFGFAPTDERQAILRADIGQ